MNVVVALTPEMTKKELKAFERKHKPDWKNSVERPVRKSIRG